MRHTENKDETVTKTTKTDAVVEKRKDMQKLLLPKTMWGEKVTDNCWHFKYLDAIYEAGGGEMTDVRRRTVMSRTRFGQLRHIWHDKRLHYNLRLRLYKASVCSIQHTYLWIGSVVSECGSDTSHQWCECKYDDWENATTRSDSEVAVVWSSEVDTRAQGTMGRSYFENGSDKEVATRYFWNIRCGGRATYWWTMDVSETSSWRELTTYAWDKDYWRARVRQCGNRGWPWKWVVRKLWKGWLWVSRWVIKQGRVTHPASCCKLWKEWMGVRGCARLQGPSTMKIINLHQSAVLSSSTASPRIHVAWSGHE